jgi:phosphorylcholine metabolism protein LicD
LPWDDDADVVLLDSEYEKLRAAFKQDPIKNFKLADFRDYDDIENPISSFVNQLGGTHTSSFQLHRRIGGISIDVFRLKPIRDKDTEWNILRHRALMGLINPKRVYYVPESKKYFRLVTRIYALSAILPRRTVAKLLLSGIYAEAGEDFSCYVVHHNIDEGIVYRKELYQNSKPIYVPFEDTELPVADNYIDVIWNRFGGSSWRYIPRSQQRRSHAGFIESTRIPQRMIRDDYMVFAADQKRFSKAARRARIVSFISRYRNFKVNAALQRYKTEIMREVTEAALAHGNIDTEKLFNEKDYVQIRNAFRKWYTAQFIRRMPRLIDIGDDYLYVICYALIYHEAEYYNAKRVMRMMEAVRRVEGRFQGLRDLIDIIEAAYYAFDKEDWDGLRELVDNNFENHPAQIDLNIMRLHLALRDAAVSGDFGGCVEMAESAWELFPENGDVIFLLAEAHSGAGNGEKAELMYRSALAITENGLTKKRILDILEGAK